jgi:hypothetical protein
MANILFSKNFLAKLTAIIRTFWWQGVQKEQQRKPIHYRSRETIYKPKNEGGLGIRKLELVNKGMLINTVWRLVHDSNSNVAKIIKAKYFPYGSLWTAPSYYPKSTFWSSILSIRHHLEHNVTIQFVNGNTSIWSQLCCPIWKELNDRLNLAQSDYQIPEKVSNLWLPNCKKWDESKIIALFGQHTLQVILHIPIMMIVGLIFCAGSRSLVACAQQKAHINASDRGGSKKPAI